jgi:glycosyltransferase involved in cell wall biosynthesis
MKILVVSHVARDPTGGAASCTLALAEQWRQQGHVVTDFYSGELPAIRAGRLTQDLLALRAAPFITAQARGHDVVLITGPIGWLSFLYLKQQRSHPLLVSLTYGLEHDDYEVQVAEAATGKACLSVLARVRYHTLLRPAVESSIAQAEYFVALRTHSVNRAIRSGWKTEDRVIATPCGVDSEALRFRRHPEKPWDGKVAWCGTTVDRKGWQYFRDGFTAAVRMIPGLTLDVLGSRLDAQAILQQFPSDVVDRVCAHPVLSRTDQFRVLSTADVFVSTSLSEGYHLALQEALAIGIPAVATSEGFIADLPPDERPVWEIPKRDSMAVVDAIRELEQDSALRVLLSKKGLSWGDLHRWSAVAEDLIASFDRALRRCHRRQV